MNNRKKTVLTVCKLSSLTLLISVSMLTHVLTTAQAANQHAKQVVPIIVSSLLLEGTNPPVVDPNPSFVQKGPFRPGAMVTITPLGSMNVAIGDSILATTATKGKVVLSQPLPDIAKWAWLSIDGLAFNENTRADDVMHLEGLIPVENGRLKGNLNIMSWLVGQRARFLADDLGNTLDNTIQIAFNEAFNEFGLLVMPNEIDFLVDRRFNKQALLFSSALLKNSAPQQSIESLVTDFADDGVINSAQGLAVLDDVSVHASQDTLDTAITNLNSEYNINLGDQTVRGLLNLRYAPCGNNIVCLGHQATVSVPAKGEEYASVKVFESGSYSLSVSHSPFNNFHRSILTSSTASARTSVGQRFDPVLSLEQDDLNIVGGAFNNFSNQAISARLTLNKLSDGTRVTPKYIPVNRVFPGTVSQVAGHSSAFYAIDAHPGLYRITLFDIISTQSMIVTVTDRSGAKQMAESDGRVTLDFEHLGGSSFIEVFYPDAAQSTRSSSFPFSLSVLAH